ncbi:D-threitol dehydrogenase [Plantactinospora mayteni]|uniref:D-threitol dehydrogenase n=1 Tax=Plantactinospora mayteni TaxID=566021 RepID=A0ABQ4EY40_9ACTN|nr:SDR family NAD(P)-dependent oxidoreductase [Plantactinospora mayteni]GIG99580.1 D-threitol dehydrogenase [Plantactinospora mayteni]
MSVLSAAESAAPAAAERPRGVVVTGAARGLGRAIAERFAAAGHAVVALDVSADAASFASGLGAGHDAVVGDAGDPETVARACERAAELGGGGLGTYVVNAGVHSTGPATEYPLEEWDRLIDVNLRAAFVGARVARGYFTDGSSVVMLSSICASQGFAGRAAYCASKAGIDGLVRSLAMEWGPDGIRVNAVAPGTIRTEMQRAAVASGAASNEQYLGRIPLERVGEPHEIADAVFYLASPQASYISGVVLPVDGGWAGGGLPASG